MRLAAVPTEHLQYTARTLRTYDIPVTVQKCNLCNIEITSSTGIVRNTH